MRGLSSPTRPSRHVRGNCGSVSPTHGGWGREYKVKSSLLFSDLHMLNRCQNTGLMHWSLSSLAPIEIAYINDAVTWSSSRSPLHLPVQDGCIGFTLQFTEHWQITKKNYTALITPICFKEEEKGETRAEPFSTPTHQCSKRLPHIPNGKEIPLEEKKLVFSTK